MPEIHKDSIKAIQKQHICIYAIIRTLLADNQLNALNKFKL